jgi:hypothetical protein
MKNNSMFFPVHIARAFPNLGEMQSFQACRGDDFLRSMTSLEFRFAGISSISREFSKS